MDNTKYIGVKFYGEGSSGYELKKAENILNSSKVNSDNLNINDIIEFYNITLYFNNDIRLTDWSDETFQDYKNISKKLETSIARYFKSINDGDFQYLYSQCEVNCKSDFWCLVDKYKVYDSLSNETIENVLRNNGFDLCHIMKNKNTVAKFSDIIIESLKTSSIGAEILVGQLIHKTGNYEKNKLYFPKSLTQSDKEIMIENFIDSDTVNYNSLTLISQFKKTSELCISPKIQLKAKRKFEAWRKSFFESNEGMRHGVKIEFSREQEEVISSDYKKGITLLSYSLLWLEENVDYPTILNNFMYVFEYIDLHFRSAFVVTPYQERPLLDSFKAKGKKDYNTGFGFDSRQMVFRGQMHLYYEFLKSKNINLEDVFKWFFEEYAVQEFNVSGFLFSPQSKEASFLDKCTTLNRELDGILKQYKYLVEDGVIDRGLVEMTSNSVAFKDLPSFLENKYAYPTDKCSMLIYLLFSGKSQLRFIAGFGKDYKDFFSILSNEQITLDSIQRHDRESIDLLINSKCLSVGQDETLKLDVNKTRVLRELYNSGVLCVLHRKAYKSTIESMVNDGELIFQSSLLSSYEQDYMDFVLNDHFANGPKLRNRYMHGTQPASDKEDEHMKDYMEILKIMVLIIMKINEELCLKYTQIE